MRPIEIVCGVYEIVHVPTGRRYIGSAADVSVRWYFHRSKLSNGKHHSSSLQEAWDADGPSAFVANVIEDCPEGQLLEREMAWIEKLGVCDPRQGFNRAWRGGDWSDADYRQMMSESARVRWNTPDGRQQLRSARAQRKDYSTFGAYARSFVKNVRNQHRPWTSADDDLLRERYVRDGLRATAEALTRSQAAVSQRALKLGLKVKGTPEFRARMRAARGDQ